MYDSSFLAPPAILFTCAYMRCSKYDEHIKCRLLFKSDYGPECRNELLASIHFVDIVSDLTVFLTLKIGGAGQTYPGWARSDSKLWGHQTHAPQVG
jgi:hypothetical protein